MNFSRSTKAGKARRVLKQKLRCPKCKSLDVEVRDYPDAQLHICQKCKFPRRLVKA